MLRLLARMGTIRSGEREVYCRWHIFLYETGNAANNNDVSAAVQIAGLQMMRASRTALLRFPLLCDKGGTMATRYIA